MADDYLSQILQSLLSGGGDMGTPAALGGPVPSEDDAMPPGRFARPQIGAPPVVPGTTVDNSSDLPARLQQMLSGATSPATDLPTNAAPLPGQGGAMIPTAAPARAPVPRRATAPPVAMPAPAAAAPQGDDLASLLRAAFTGTATVRPGQGKLSAFATGGAGSMQNLQSEKERAEKLKASNEVQNFNRTLAMRRDARAENADQRGDLREQRQATSTGKTSVFQQKMEVGMRIFNNDEAKAAEWANGKRKASDEQITKWALDQAQTEIKDFTSPADRAKKDARVEELKRIIKGAQGDQPGAQPSKLGGPDPSTLDGPGLPEQPALPGLPKAGAIMQGYRFKGGDAGDKNAWEAVE